MAGKSGGTGAPSPPRAFRLARDRAVGHERQLARLVGGRLAVPAGRSLWCLTAGRRAPLRRCLHFGRLAAHPPGLRRDVLRELGEGLQRVEDLEVPLGPPLQPIAVRLGKRPAGILFAFVDDLPGLGH